LEDWYNDEKVQKVLKTVDPRLLFNADETDLNRKGGGPRWVASGGSKQPVFITTDHNGSHVSLFLMVSASRMPVFPFPIIHGKPVKFADVRNNEYVKLYLTPKGYMTKSTFEKIMSEVFIPYVKTRRQVLGLPEDAPAALVLDGHNSRYHPPVLEELKKNFIDVLIIPAHSSHKTQPLDLTLNKLVKEHYKSEVLKSLNMIRKEVQSSIEKAEAQKKKEAEQAQTKDGNDQRQSEVGKDQLEIEEEMEQSSDGDELDQLLGVDELDVSDDEDEIEQSEDEDEIEKPAPKRARVAECATSTSEKAESGKEKKKKPIVLKPEQKRLAMVIAAVNSVQMSLIYRNIVSSWKTSKLYPFDGTPPFSPEDEQNEQKEIEDTGIVPPAPRSKVVRLTGVITTEEAINDIRQVIETRMRIKAARSKIERRCTVVLGTVTEEIDTSDGTVGNFIELKGVPVKRPRGRPRSVTSGVNPPPKTGRSRGRPSCTVRQSTAISTIRGKSRGRPRKQRKEPETPPTVPPDIPPSPRRVPGHPPNPSKEAKSRGFPRKQTKESGTPPSIQPGIPPPAPPSDVPVNLPPPQGRGQGRPPPPKNLTKFPGRQRNSSFNTT